MSKTALALAVIALALGGYAAFGPKPEEGPAPASAEALAALKEEVGVLRAALDAAGRARGESQARVEALEAAAKAQDARLDALQAKADERLAVLEARKPSADGHVEARSLAIVRDDGTPAIRMGTRAGAGRIEVFAKNGKRVALLFARTDHDGELALYDENGALRANIGGNDDGGYANFYGREDALAAYVGGDSNKASGYIAVYGPDKQEIASLYGNPKGGVVSVRNLATKKQVAMLGAAPNNGMGFLGLGTADGKPGFAGFVTENGGQFKTLNAAGETATFIGVSAKPAGNGLLYVCRKEGERVLESGTTDTGGGYLSIHNGNKKRVLFLGASSGTAPDDGVLEVARKNGKLGVVLRGYSGGSSVRVYDNSENVKVNLR